MHIQIKKNLVLLGNVTGEISCPVSDISAVLYPPLEAKQSGLQCMGRLPVQLEAQCSVVIQGKAYQQSEGASD